MDLYGLNPNMLPYAFQFPRIPPGSTPLMFNSTTESVRKNSDLHKIIIYVVDEKSIKSMNTKIRL